MQLKRSELFRVKCYTEGKWQGAQDGSVFPVHNPSTRALLGKVPKMGVMEVQAAIAFSVQAQRSWRKETAKERSRILRCWYELITTHLEDLAILITLEQGKPVEDARREMEYSASFVEWFSEEAKRVYGDVIPSVIEDQRLFVIKQPVGVVGAITPWNFPNAMVTRKCAPALAAGCSVVLKPAEATPFSALALAFLAEEAGVPPGVLQVLTGEPAVIGQEMTSNPAIRKITFTGSTRVGKLLMSQSAATVKRISLELGGNAPFIVFSDADIAESVKGLIASKFRNSGQSCICADRVFVESSIYDSFVQELIVAVRALKVGDGFEPGVQQGPLINEAAVERLECYVRKAVEQGASLLCGGKRIREKATFFEPTVLCDVTSAMEIVSEETFGPVIGLIRFKTEAEALALANATRYGLASYLYTKDVNRVFRVAEQLDFGMVSVNGGLFSNAVSPFGGIKESGFGREGSQYGLDEYLDIKSITLTGNRVDSILVDP